MENTPISEESKDLSLRPYQLEVQRIKDKHGDLDQIRMKLGMSRRQTCQLLLVDPSAWTRWIKTDAPAHVYQALNWLLELKKTNPEAAGPVNLHTRVEKVEGLFALKVQSLEKQISQIESLLGHWMIMQRTVQAQQQQVVGTKVDPSSSQSKPSSTRRSNSKAKYAKKAKKQKINKRKKVQLLVKKKTKRVLKKKNRKKPRIQKKKMKFNRLKPRNRRK